MTTRTAWKIAYEKERNGEQGAYLVVDSSDPKMLIARVPPTLPRSARRDVADLLAGAPELYEVARSVIDTHNEPYKDMPVPHCFCEDVCLPLLYALDLCDGTVRREAEAAAKRKRAERKRK